MAKSLNDTKGLGAYHYRKEEGNLTYESLKEAMRSCTGLNIDDSDVRQVMGVNDIGGRLPGNIVTVADGLDIGAYTVSAVERHWMLIVGSSELTFHECDAIDYEAFRRLYEKHPLYRPVSFKED